LRSFLSLWDYQDRHLLQVALIAPIKPEHFTTAFMDSTPIRSVAVPAVMGLTPTQHYALANGGILGAF
jgi:hypothetical protein